MKTKLLILAIISFFVVSCFVCKDLKKPANLKPVDRENYNDGETVFYNCKQQCIDEPNPYQGDTIKVFGWGKGGRKFILYEDSTFTKEIGYSWYDINIYDAYGLQIPENIGIYYIKGVVNNHCQTRNHCDLEIDVLEYNFINKEDL
ncbi:MAG: hypothetical protein LBS50_11840 [Prevotellaceae bacterium]|jgi:hypothetical protein|nr:hypothetical protein [Prevotellaceae bacterium]